MPDGAWKGLAAVKAIYRHLFTVFSLDLRLEKERTKASKRLEKKAGKTAHGRFHAMGRRVRDGFLVGRHVPFGLPRKPPGSYGGNGQKRSGG